jgi:hypothetical protein
MINKSVAVVKWVIRDFQLRHLVRNMYNSQSLVFSLIDCRASISLPIICILNYFYTYWFYIRVSHSLYLTKQWKEAVIPLLTHLFCSE